MCQSDRNAPSQKVEKAAILITHVDTNRLEKSQNYYDFQQFIKVS